MPWAPIPAVRPSARITYIVVANADHVSVLRCALYRRDSRTIYCSEFRSGNTSVESTRIAMFRPLSLALEDKALLPEPLLAIALYDFEGEIEMAELSFTKGQMLVRIGILTN